MPARPTTEPGKARREASARQKVFEGPFHESRKALAVTSPRRLRAERLVVIPDNLVQYLLLRAARPIDKGRERHGTVERKVRAQRVVAMND